MRGRVKAADCSDRQLLRIVTQCGFEIHAGKKHWKVKTSTGVFITTIPRHNRLKKETVRGIVRQLNAFGVEIEVA